MFLCSAIPSRKFKITARTHIYKNTHTHTLSSTHTYTYKYTTVKPIFNTVDLNVREPWGDKHTKNKPAWRQQITQRRRWPATLLSQRNKVSHSCLFNHILIHKFKHFSPDTSCKEERKQRVSTLYLLRSPAAGFNMFKLWRGRK